MGKNNKANQKEQKSKAKDTKVKNKQQKLPSPKKVNALQKSFESSKAKQDGGEVKTGAEVTKAMQSGFITYVKFCCTSKDSTAASQASSILSKYQQLQAPEKRQLVCNFFASGGKKPGLSSVYHQSLTLEQATQGGSWSGYVTPEKLMELHGVLWEERERESERA